MAATSGVHVRHAKRSSKSLQRCVGPTCRSSSHRSLGLCQLVDFDSNGRGATNYSQFLSFFSQGVGVKSNVNEEGTESTLKGTWDWERESKIREVCEEMERWAIKAQLRSS
ncbi:hypothetical protein Golax_003142 [Gossypium laxum]|uniref:Uncharacterized protein n=1 Tax=Gossypium laxum TaxID=34288 RepID=A0A7J9AEP3_9ROSI|nr:hypothetical protein [Gossypium laxum]